MNDSISDVLQVLNAKMAIDIMGDEESYNEMLKMYDDSLMPTLRNLQQAMNEFNYKEIRMQSHSIKGPSSYIGGERLRRAAEIVQFNVDKQQGPNLFRNYPLIIEESFKLRREIRRYISSKIDKKPESEFKEDPEDSNIPFCKFYKFSSKDPIHPKVEAVGNIDYPPVPFVDIVAKKPNAQHNSQQNKSAPPPPTKQQQSPEEKKVMSSTNNSLPEKKQEKAKEVQKNELGKNENHESKKNEADKKEKEKKEETTSCSCILL